MSVGRWLGWSVGVSDGGYQWWSLVVVVSCGRWLGWFVVVSGGGYQCMVVAGDVYQWWSLVVVISA